jgi:histidinol dehydrogenase
MIALRTIDLGSLTAEERSTLTTRSPVPDHAVRAAAAAIVDDVRKRGDVAVREHSALHGGGPVAGPIAVPGSTIAAAVRELSPTVRAAIEAAIDAVTFVHLRQRPVDDVVEVRPGVVVERRWSPLRRVGVYVPGGRAAYPSSLLMGVVPARVAGAGSVAVATPCADDGTIDAVVLAAAGILDVDEVYAVGGAQAVAALAYGTESVARVDKIVGPGGPWVTAAKLAVYGDCAVDLPAGPSEALIVADASADPEIAAADLLCQAEHGAESPVVLVTTDPAITTAVLDAAERRVGKLAREAIIRSALADHGMAVVASDLGDALAFADEWAPEHLTLHVADPAAAADSVTSAGSVFVGRWTPESAGDYATGANHVLPTGGLARAHGPLAVDDFGSWRQVQTLDRRGLEALAPVIRTLATVEGLTAHAACVDARFEEAG